MIFGLSVLNTLVLVMLITLWRDAPRRARQGIAFLLMVLLANLIGWRLVADVCAYVSVLHQ